MREFSSNGWHFLCMCLQNDFFGYKPVSVCILLMFLAAEAAALKKKSFRGKILVVTLCALDSKNNLFCFKEIFVLFLFFKLWSIYC